MDLNIAFQNLVDSLEQEITLYRAMLDVVRQEHEILIASNLNDLLENNKIKDAIVMKLRSTDRIRDKRVKEISTIINYKSESPRILEIASYLDQGKGDKLRSIHTTLDLMVKRIKEHNEKNEVLTQAALRNITGALESLKSSLETKPVYKNEGNVDKGAITTGRFVSKEA